MTASARVRTGRVLLLCASLGFGLVAGGVCAEWALVRHYGSRAAFVRAPDFDSPYLYRLAPGLAGGNELGILRDEPTILPKPPGRFRVLSYGDSIATGYGIEASAMYARRLERDLVDSEVLSMARGHSPTAYSFHLRADLPRLGPDAVVVLVELSNDVSDEARVRTRGRDSDGLALELSGYRYALSWDDQLLAPTPIAPFGFGRLERSRLYYALSRWIGRVRARLHPPPAFDESADTFYYSLSSDRYLLSDEALAAGFDRLFATLAGMQRLLAARGVHFAVAVQPSEYVFAKGDRYQPGAQRLLARARERAEALGIPALFLTDAFRAAGGRELFLDFCHPTEAGNEVIARALQPLLSGWQAETSAKEQAARSAER